MNTTALRDVISRHSPTAPANPYDFTPAYCHDCTRAGALEQAVPWPCSVLERAAVITKGADTWHFRPALTTRHQAR